MSRSFAFRPNSFPSALLYAASLAAAVVYAAPALAASLSGVVRSSETGQPLAGARIQVERVQGGRPYQTRTDASGAFSIPSLEPGEYRVRALHPSFAVVEQRVRVQEAGGSLELSLSASAIPTAEVVEVEDRAVVRQTPAAFSNLSRQDLEERAAMRDLPLLLSELPSTTFYSENGNGVGYNYMTLRGFDQRRVSVMIDGVPQNDPEDHNVYWANFFDLAGSLEDVQVQRGGGAGFYGPPAIGGSINMVTRQFSHSPYQRMDVGYGSYTTRRLTAEVNTGLLKDKWVAYGRFSHLQSEGYRDWSWSRFFRYFGGVTRYGNRSSLRLQVYGGPQEDALAYYGIPREYNDDPVLRRTNWSAGKDLERFNQTHVDLIHEYQATDALTVRNTLFYIDGRGYFDFDGSWGDPYYFRLCSNDPVSGDAVGDYPAFCLDAEDPDYQGIPSDTLIRAWVGNQQVGWLPRLTLRHGEGNMLNVGAELRVHRSLHWGRIQAGTGYPEEIVGDADRHFYEYRGGKDILSPYVNEQLRLGRFAIEGNLQAVLQRYRIYDEAFVGTEFTESYLFLNPRLGVNYNFSHWLNAFASVSQTHREPRLKELYDAELAAYGYGPLFQAGVDQGLNVGAVFTQSYGRPEVKFETLKDLELGLHLEHSRVRATVNGFYMDFRNELVKTGGLDQYGVPRVGNAERTRHAGVELEAGVRLIEGLDLSGNVTFSKNRFVRFDEYIDDYAGAVVQDGNPIAGFPDLLGNLRLSYRRGGLMLSIDGKYVGRQYTDNSGGYYPDGTVAYPDRVVDPYTLVGATAAYRFPATSPLTGFTVGIEGNNLLNAQVLATGYEDEFFPLAPLNAFAWLRYER